MSDVYFLNLMHGIKDFINKKNKIRALFRLILTRTYDLLTKKTYEIINKSDFLNKYKIKSQEFHEKQIEMVRPCAFYGIMQQDAPTKTESYLSPGSSFFEIKDVLVLGRSDIFFKDKFAVFPDGFNAKHHLCNIEKFGIGDIKIEKNSLRTRLKPNAVLQKAISILSDGSGNYAHFLTEVIPQLVAINSIPDLKKIPLIADGWVGEHIIKILCFFNDNKREIILSREWEVFFVKHMFCLSSPTQAPQDFRINFEITDNNKTPDSYKFTASAFQSVREEVAARCVSLGIKFKKYKKIYLKRLSTFRDGIQYNLRSIANDDEVCHFLEGKGFKIIDITQLSFGEQVMLFSEVDFVIAPAGAVLANLIFCNKNIKVIILSAYYENADYSYFTKMISALGHNLSYVVGPQVDFYDKHPAHKRYTISIDSLSLAIKETE